MFIVNVSNSEGRFKAYDCDTFPDVVCFLRFMCSSEEYKDVSAIFIGRLEDDQI